MLLPTWSQWVGPALWLLCVFAFAIVIQLILQPGHRRAVASDGVHWTERARRIWGRRLLAGHISWVTALAIAYFGSQSIGPLSAWSPRLFVGAVILEIYACIVAFGFVFERRVHGSWLTFGRYLRGRLSLVTLMLPSIPVAVVMGILLPAEWSITSVIGAGIGAVAIYWLSTGGGFVVARALGLVRPVTEDVQARVDAAAVAVGHEGCRAYVVDGIGANAFALHAIPAVVFSERALACLQPEQVEAVAHHEFGHLVESRAMQVVKRLPLFFVLACALWNPLVHSFGILGFVSILLFGFALIAMISSRLVQSEERADEHAHRAGDQAVYARALETIHESNLVPAAMGTRSKSHPDLYDRMIAAGVTPDYPRPEPPLQYRRTSMWMTVGLVVALAGIEILRLSVVQQSQDPRMAIALAPRPSWALMRLADDAVEAERTREAITWLRAADEMTNRGRVDLPARLALLHEEVGERELARETYRSAKERRAGRINVPAEVEELLRRGRALFGQ